jgi:hypothetical protein
MAAAMRKAMTALSFRDANFRRVWAAFALVLFLTLQVLSTSTALHKLIHADAGSLDHHCVITLFTRGQVSTAETFVPLVAFVAALFFLLPMLRSAEVSAPEYRFSASRAPPRR